MWDPALPSQIAQSALRFATSQERRSFIANACQGDAALQQQALAVLAAFESTAFQNPALVNPALQNPALQNPALANPALGNPAFNSPALALPARPLPGMPSPTPPFPSPMKPKSGSRKTGLIIAGAIGGVALLLLLIASPFLYGAYSSWSLKSTEKKAAELKKYGKFKESAAAYEKVVAMYKSKYGADDEKTLDQCALLGKAYQFSAQYDKARATLTETAELQKAKLGPAASKTIGTLFGLADVLRKENKIEEELLLRESIIATMRQHRQPNDGGTAQCLDEYVDACLQVGQRPRSLAAQEELLDYFRAAAGPNEQATQIRVIRLITTYVDCKKPEKAIALAEANLSTIKQLFGTYSDQHFEALKGLENACTQLQRTDEATKWRQAHEEAKRTPPPLETYGVPPGG
jgi:tetratricopeptide (TPR) repeat protein